MTRLRKRIKGLTTADPPPIRRVSGLCPGRHVALDDLIMIVWTPSLSSSFEPIFPDCQILYTHDRSHTHSVPCQAGSIEDMICKPGTRRVRSYCMLSGCTVMATMLASSVQGVSEMAYLSCPRSPSLRVQQDLLYSTVSIELRVATTVLNLVLSAASIIEAGKSK